MFPLENCCVWLVDRRPVCFLWRAIDAVNGRGEDKRCQGLDFFFEIASGYFSVAHEYKCGEGYWEKFYDETRAY
jgi:hypothetical protein